MKNQVNQKNYAYGVFFAILMFATFSGKSQQKLINVNGWNAYVHVPWDYNQTTKNYPAIVFIPGLGEVGTDANRLISNGPGSYLTQGWNGNVKVGNDSVKFIIISLQPPSAWPRPWDVKNKIDILKKQYRFTNYYMTGLSMGGWTSLWYSYYYPDEISTLVGVESVVPTDYGIEEDYKAPAVAGQKYLLFEQQNDYRKNDSVVYWMNQYSPGSSDYVYTAFNGGGHCCWSEFYGGGGKQPQTFSVDGNNINLYEYLARNAAQKGILPVTIESVTAQEDHNAIKILWNTSSELHSNYFEVQRSSNGQDYKKLGVVFAAGNSNVLKQYSFTDEIPAKGNNFYRLKMVDLDGQYAMSKTVSVLVKSANNMVVKTARINHTTGSLTIDLNSATDNLANIYITDINGRTLYRSENQILEGNNLISEKLSLPTKGVYYLRIMAGENRITKTLLSE